MSEVSLRVKKRSGQLVKFRPEKILRVINKASESAGEGIDTEKVSREAIIRITRRHQKVITVEEIQDIIEDVLVKNDLTAVAKSFILYRKRRQEDREAKNAIIGKAIKAKLSLNAVKLLHNRYLLRNEEGKVIETPDELFERVAGAVAEAEGNYVKELPEAAIRKWKSRFKKAILNLDIIPSSSVLMSAGLDKAQLGASIALPIRDHLTEIFETLKNAVDMQRYGAGTGFDFSQLRERMSPIGEHGGRSEGPLQFLHVYNNALSIILQNGRRKGANMAILDVHHPDILDFISAKVKDYHLTNFNISAALTEEFITAAILDKEYNLNTPTTGEPVKIMYAKQVFDILVASAWNYAEPGVLFWDLIEQENPIPSSPISATSPCAEFMLSEYEIGYLASINLSNFVSDNKIDYKRLKEAIKIGIRFLDDMIDVTYFPLKESEKVVKKNRKIGLGVMGWAHMLYQLGVPYNSEEGIALAEEVASFIKTEAETASEELAAERGVFPSWRRSIHKNNRKKLRNATLLAISPTGSASIIANTSSSIEPVFALSYIKHTADGKELPYLDPYLKKALIKEGIFNNQLVEIIINKGLDSSEIPESIKKVFVTTHDVSPEYHVRMQAAWQKYVDNGVSKTVNLPQDATLIDVENVFLLAYKLGCKGVTVYREGTKEGQVLKLTTLIQKKSLTGPTKSIREELKNQLVNKQLSEFS